VTFVDFIYSLFIQIFNFLEHGILNPLVLWFEWPDSNVEVTVYLQRVMCFESLSILGLIKRF